MQWRPTRAWSRRLLLVSFVCISAAIALWLLPGSAIVAPPAWLSTPGTTLLAILSAATGVVSALAAVGSLSIARRQDSQMRRQVRVREQAGEVHQLPRAVADLVGRRDSLTRLSEHLRPGQKFVPIALISGPPGIGKTALARQLAHGLLAHYPDVQLHVDLAGAERNALRPEAVLDDFIRALAPPGVRVANSLGARAAQYRHLLNDRRSIVWLDNAADESQVESLIPNGSQCAVIVTSRKRLHINQAHVESLDSLSAVESAQLLSHAAGTDLSRNADGQRIARCCGGVPLALNIAGARLARSTMSARRLADQLETESKKLAGLAMGNQSVRAAYNLSYEGLTREEQHLFRYLGLPSSPTVTVWAAMALTDRSGDEVERLLDSLVTASLVMEVGEDEAGLSRYRLHDLLKSYASEVVRGAENVADQHQALRRLLSAYHDFARPGTSRLAGGYSVRQDLKHSWNIGHDAFRRQATQDSMLWFRVERESILKLLMQAHTEGITREISQLASSLFYYFEIGAYWEDWRFVDRLALEVARATGDRTAEADALRNLGKLELDLIFERVIWRIEVPRWQAGQWAREEARSTKGADNSDVFDRAEGLLVQSDEIFRGLGMAREVALVQRYLADLDRGRGLNDAALRRYTNVLAASGRVVDDTDDQEDLIFRASVEVAKGQAHLAARQFDAAALCFERGRHIGHRLNHRRLLAFAIRRQGDVKLAVGSHPLAREYFLMCIPIFRQLGDTAWEARTLVEAAVTTLGDSKKLDALAVAQLTSAVSLFKSIGSPEADDVAGFLHALGRTGHR